MNCDWTDEIRLLLKAGPWFLAFLLLAIMAWRDSWPWKRRGGRR